MLGKRKRGLHEPGIDADKVALSIRKQQWVDILTEKKCWSLKNPHELSKQKKQKKAEKSAGVIKIKSLRHWRIPTN